MIRSVLLVLLLLLSGCAELISPEQAGKIPAFSFLNTYDAALKDFEKGRIMTARGRIMAMDKSRDDYPAAVKLLKTKVEPARLRLLRHYSSAGASSERAGRWFDAMTQYAQAAELSTQPASLLKKRDTMEIRMRQQRMDTLIDQRRAEDAYLLSWLNSYEPPKGVSPKDDAFQRSLEQMQEMVEERGSQAYSDARRYLGKDLPELAYVEIESYLRLVPDSDRGKSLMADIRKEMAKTFRIAAYKNYGVRSVSTKRVALPETVKREQVVDLIRKGDWIKAKRYALIYRREGGKDGDHLLRQIQTNIEKDAAGYFARGRVAFRQEMLEKAIEYWEKAVALEPENSEYVNALQRARQLQERLRVLKSDAKSDSSSAQ